MESSVRTEEWIFALDLGALARIVGTTDAQLVTKLSEGHALQESSPSPRPRPKVGVALVTAARRRSGEVPKELLEIGGSSVICHSLRTLEAAGVGRAVVVVGSRGAEIVDHVRRRRSEQEEERMPVEFVDLGDDWSGTHAESVLRAAPRLRDLCGDTFRDVPLLLVTSDHLFDRSLVEAMLRIQGENALLVEGGLHERQLADDLLPPTAVRVRTRLEKKRRPGSDDDDVEDDSNSNTEKTSDDEEEADFWCERVGRKVRDHDAFDAGLVRVDGPRIFEALEVLATTSATTSKRKYYALCDALDVVARRSRLRAVFARDRPWLAIETEQQFKHLKVRLNSPAYDPGSMPFQVVEKETTLALRLGDNDDKAFLEEEEEDDDDERTPTTTTPTTTTQKTAPPPETPPFSSAASLVVSRSEAGTAAFAVVPRAFAEECRAHCEARSVTFDQFLGSHDASDLTSISLDVDDDVHTEELSPKLKLKLSVERAVPAVAWVVLGTATAVQASGAIVFATLAKNGETPPDRLASLCWRPLAAALAALPLAVASRLGEPRDPPTLTTTTTKNSPSPPQRRRSPRHVVPLVMSSACLWLTSSAYALAFDVASSPDDVVLATSLTPLFVVAARAAGIFGTFPASSEVLGTGLGLAGASFCAASLAKRQRRTTGVLPASPAEQASPVLALCLCLICDVTNVCLQTMTKSCRVHYAAPDLHVLQQFGAFLVSFAVLALRRGKGLLSADPVSGAFGFLAPSRLPFFLWTGVAVDTLGTFGYVVALRWIDPLLTTVACLFQPLCAALEEAAYQSDLTLLPPPSYYVGVLFLVAGAALVVDAQNHSSKKLKAHDALVVVQQRQGRDPGVPGRSHKHTTPFNNSLSTTRKRQDYYKPGKKTPGDDDERAGLVGGATYGATREKSYDYLSP